MLSAGTRRSIEAAGGVVQHYKGALYRVVGPARHTETGERLIVYHPVNRPYELWARPADMYGSEVSLSNGLTVARFRRVYPKRVCTQWQLGRKFWPSSCMKTTIKNF